MAQLKHMVNGIYQIVKSGGTDVYSEYEKIPVMERKYILKTFLSGKTISFSGKDIYLTLKYSAGLILPL